MNTYTHTSNEQTQTYTHTTNEQTQTHTYTRTIRGINGMIYLRISPLLILSDQQSSRERRDLWLVLGSRKEVLSEVLQQVRFLPSRSIKVGRCHRDKVTRGLK